MTIEEVIAELEKASEGSRELDQSLLSQALSLVAAHDGSDTCILWPGRGDAKGRGRVWVNGVLKLAHRAVWEIVSGPIPAGKMLCHTCDNPPCINPSHLYVGTHADNTRDAVERGRYGAALQPERYKEMGRIFGAMNDWAEGERNPKAKLTTEQVASIRSDKRATRFIAADYGVDRTTVQRIRRGALWA